MQLCNSGENARRSYIGVTSRTYIWHDQWAIFRFQSVTFFNFDFDPIAVIVISLCVSMPHFTNIGSLTAEIWRLIGFQDGGRCGAILPPYRTGWRHFLQKVSHCLWAYTKYRQDISIHGRDVTISVLQKQTSAIFEFYFRFRSRPLCRNLHGSASDNPISSKSEHPVAKIWRHIHVSRWRPRPLNTTSGFVFLMSLPSEGLSSNQISSTSQFTAEI